jgi:tetratricopeptide (TPR) repeat protein
VKQIVCTVGRNLQDCPPFASRHGANFGGEKKAAWEKLFSSGTAAESAGQFAGATTFYSQAAQLDNGSAELHFRWARCLSALGRHGEARRSFETACDLDTLRFRADSRINDILRENAQGRMNDGIYFVDASAALATNSPQGLPGEEFFYEHVHLTFEGNYIVARALADQIEQLLPPEITRSSASSAWLSSAQCARRLAWTDWGRQRVLEDIHQRLLDPPFTNQLGWAERHARIEAQLSELSARRASNVLDALQQNASAIASDPDDWVLREHFGEALRESRRPREAIEQQQHVVRLLPHHAAAWNNLGNLCNALGSATDAKRNFAEALRLRPDMVEAMNGMGLTLAKEGKPEEAIGFYMRALRIKPDFVAVHVNLGTVLAAQGNASEARKHFNEALRRKPNDGSAHGNLAKLLARQGQQPEALKHFAAAARLMSNNAAARFNYGNALLAQHQDSAALGEYSAAIRLEPDFAEARANLGTLLVRRGQWADAETHLSEAVRLNSNSAPAHLGLAVALEQQGKLSEAARHYRETLRIDPANATAKKRLESLTGR